tara:strand:- start:48 stop:1130 length:1083 start_codon:yes stop_codon:yes gene_type:complete
MKLITILLFTFLTISCSKDSEVENNTSEDFNTQAMIVDITNQLILPKVNNFNSSCIELNNAVNNYIATPSEENIILMRTKWKETSSNYAQVYAFNIGEARNRFFHIKLYNWPTLSIAIENFISDANEITATYVSQLSSQAKTLSGIEYMLFKSSAAEVHQGFINSPKRLDYLKFITISQKDKAAELLNLWSTDGENYANTFMNNTDSGLNAPLNRLYNGIYNIISTAKITKIGKSAGLENSDNVNFDELQARYSGFSKELIIKNLEISKEVFFNEQGLGLSDNIIAVTGDEVLNNILKTKFNTAINSLKNLNGSLAQAITNSPDDVRIIHEQLQEIIVLLAIDVRSALSIIITSTDNDGD